MEQNKTLDDVIRSMEDILSTIEAHPDKPRAYKELYDLVESSLSYITNRKDFGLFFKSFEGDLSSRYHVTLRRGLMADILEIYLHSSSEQPMIKCISLILIGIFNKTPAEARNYEKDPSTGFETKSEMYNLLVK
jgi:hypothetical protein